MPHQDSSSLGQRVSLLLVSAFCCCAFSKADVVQLCGKCEREGCIDMCYTATAMETWSAREERNLSGVIVSKASDQYPRHRTTDSSQRTCSAHRPRQPAHPSWPQRAIDPRCGPGTWSAWSACRARVSELEQGYGLGEGSNRALDLCSSEAAQHVQAVALPFVAEHRGPVGCPLQLLTDCTWGWQTSFGLSST